MEIGGIISGSILGIFAVVLGVYVSFTARCKGPILSNPWIWMSKEERERELAKVNIKAEYRQLTITLGGIALALAYFAVFCFSSFRLPLFPMWILIGIVVVYAIASSVKFAMRGSDSKK